MRKVFDYEKNTLLYQTQNGLCYDLQLRGNITIIRGDAATGKTYLFNCLQEEKNLSSMYDVSNITLINTKQSFNFEDKRNLVIIDEGDKVLHHVKDACKRITQSENAHFLIFCRGAYDLYVSPNHFGEFYKDENGIIRIYYEFNVPSWC